MKNLAFKRVARDVMRRVRPVVARAHDILMPAEGEYSVMLKHAMTYVCGCEVLGDYLEFGSSRGITMSAAFKHAQNIGLRSMKFFSFDSFEGLPEISGIDADGPCHYHKGEYACSLDQFRQNLATNRV